MHILGTQHLLSISPRHAKAQGLANLEESTLFLRGLARDLPAASNYYVIIATRFIFPIF